MTAKLVDKIKGMATIPIASIVGFARGNPKAPTKEDVDVLDASLDENGLVMPPLVRELADDRFELLDGHTRIDRIRAKYPGTFEIKVLIIDCESYEEGRKIILGLKNSAGWDMTALDRWVKDAIAEGMSGDTVMKLSGMSAADLDSLAEWGAAVLEDMTKVAGRIETTPSSAEKKPEPQRTPTIISEVDIPEVPAKRTISRVGTIWTLGSSRLVCGDMQIPEVITAALAGGAPNLLVTDLPGPHDISEKTKKMKPAEIDEIIVASSRILASVMGAGAPAYAIVDADHLAKMDAAFELAGFRRQSWIALSRSSPTLGRKHYHSQFDLMWYGWREGAPCACSPTDRNLTDVWQVERPRKADQHPTVRSVGVIGRVINASSKHGDLVFDPFAGAGTTLLAAEQMSRRAALVEISPGLCDVIVERWQNLTGRQATKNG